LMTNAIKYGGSPGRIDVTCELNDKEKVLSVIEHGPGIAEEEKRNLFEPGISKSVRGWPQGTGLGLYESRRLLHLLGWEITAADNEPTGAKFEIRIPRDWRQDYARS